MGWWGNRPRTRDQELDDEIGFDLALEINERVRSGMPRQEAEHESLREFGNVLSIKERTRETWRWTRFEGLAQDLRHAARTLRGSPRFSLAAVLSLALGSGAATALFSVVHGLLIAPYPYASPDELWGIEVRDREDRHEWAPFHYSQYVELEKLPALAGVMATAWENRRLTGTHHSGSLSVLLVSGNMFSFLGTPALHGRTIQPSDIKPSGDVARVAVVSYGASLRWFGASASAIGRTLSLDGQPYTVIGVMPQRFGWFADVWLPLPANPQTRTVSFAVRMRPGIPRQRAEEQLHGLFQRLERETPGQFPQAGFTTALWNYADVKATSDMRSALGWLSLVAGFLLVISCANAANLQLARATTRAREMAVRIALGAPSARILRQLLAEGVLMSMAGGAAGFSGALAAVRAIDALMPGLSGSRPNNVHVGMNWPAPLFLAAVSLLTGMVCGLAPAAQCLHADLCVALKDACRSSETSKSGGWIRNLLVIIELGLSVILLFGAVSSARALRAKQDSVAGFQEVRVLAAPLRLSPSRYATYQSRAAFARNLLERLKRLPGVRSAAVGNNGLFHFGGLQTRMSIIGAPPSRSERVSLALISADYPETLGVPLRGGRVLTAREIDSADPVALINQMAARLWPEGKSPIGSRVGLDFLRAPTGEFLIPPESLRTGDVSRFTIVGILADTKPNEAMGTTSAPLVLIPYTLLAPSFRKLFVRTDADPAPLWEAVRQEVQALDDHQAVPNAVVVEGSFAADISQYRFDMILFTLIASLGLVLAGMGLYGVISYAVGSRSQEIAIRLALGAGRGRVQQMLLATGGRLVVIGLTAGLLGVLLLIQRLGARGPRLDLTAAGSVAALLILPASLACYIPTRRAARLAVCDVLRHE